MNRRTEKPLWVFLHIPKTAGSSVRSIIEENVPVERLARMYGPKNKIPLEQLVYNARLKLLHADILYGHIEAKVHEYVDRECKYFTVLRDPVERVLSSYKYVKYDAKYLSAHAKLNRISIEEWLEDNPPNISNLMSKRLAGYAGEEDPSGVDLFGEAVETLRNMPVFGLQERFKESLTLICETLDWPIQYAERNRSSMTNREFLEKENVTESVLGKIRGLNKIDRELHKYASELFGEQKGRKGKRFFSFVLPNTMRWNAL